MPSASLTCGPLELSTSTRSSYAAARYPVERFLSSSLQRPENSLRQGHRLAGRRCFCVAFDVVPDGACDIDEVSGEVNISPTKRYQFTAAKACRAIQQHHDPFPLRQFQKHRLELCRCEHLRILKKGVLRIALVPFVLCLLTLLTCAAHAASRNSAYVRLSQVGYEAGQTPFRAYLMSTTDTTSRTASCVNSNVYLPRFPFRICVSLSLLQPIATGYVLRGQGQIVRIQNGGRAKQIFKSTTSRNHSCKLAHIHVQAVFFSVI